MPVLVGTSGWQYRSWRGTFYPRSLAQGRWLDYYSQRFAAVEVNNSFYRLPEAHTFEDWARRTPHDFTMAVKLSRYVTHVRRLREPAGPIERFAERARLLGSKLGPVLIQLPPTLGADHDRLEEVLEALQAVQALQVVQVLPTLHVLGGHAKVTVEFRHQSWFTERTYELLARYGAALCLADRPGWRTPLVRTADWTYLRLHEGAASPRPCYGRTALDSWARRLAQVWTDDSQVFVFFNNDTRGCAVRNAREFARAAQRWGFRATRVPRASDIDVT
jgi:uncharacterized protein YecE (DUF72 family)